MKKLTCILLSFLLFATPLFAVKYINIYNKKGKKIGYVENEKGQLIYYDINNNKKGALVNYDFYGNKTGEIYLDYYYEKEIKRIRRSKFVAASSFLTFVWSANMEWIDSNNISTYSAISEVTSIALLISGAMYIYYYLTTPKKTSSTKYKIVNYNYKIPNKQKNEPNYEMWQYIAGGILGAIEEGEREGEKYNNMFNASTKGCHVYGSIKIVNVGADYTVRKVSVGGDLSVKYVNNYADSPGLWKIVQVGADYTVRFVNVGGDFTIQEVSTFPGCN